MNTGFPWGSYQRPRTKAAAFRTGLPKDIITANSVRQDDCSGPRLVRRGTSHLTTTRRLPLDVTPEQNIEVRQQQAIPRNYRSKNLLPRKVVYDKPFAVLNPYILSGERDREEEEFFRTEMEKKFEKRRLPKHLKKLYESKHPFHQKMKYLYEVDPKLFFQNQVENNKQE